MTQDNSTVKVKIEVKKEYYESGALEVEIPYVNGKMHGISRGYYESGALKYETPYVNGAKHGIGKGYHETGALWIEIPYKNGKMHGIEKKYNSEKSVIDRLTLCSNDRLLLSLYREG